jgi:hypothetical protein
MHSAWKYSGNTKYDRVDIGLLGGETQNHILINSSETADGVNTPDSVMMPDTKSGGCNVLDV